MIVNIPQATYGADGCSSGGARTYSDDSEREWRLLGEPGGSAAGASASRGVSGGELKAETPVLLLDFLQQRRR